MDTKDTIVIVISFVTTAGTVVAVWWQLDSKIESRVGRLETLLTNNLITLQKGEKYGHTPGTR